MLFEGGKTDHSLATSEQVVTVWLQSVFLGGDGRESVAKVAILFALLTSKACAQNGYHSYGTENKAGVVKVALGA